MKKINLIIAGGREFRDYTALCDQAKKILAGYKRKDILIISGTARGADQLGERFAKQYGLHLARMPAQWDKFGKSAGYRRNTDMAARATHVMVCWDGMVSTVSC